MADDKRNALFNKIFGKKAQTPQPALTDEDATLDAIMNYEEAPEDIKKADSYEDWLAEALTEDGASTEDVSGAIEELFGTDTEDDYSNIVPELLSVEEETEEEIVAPILETVYTEDSVTEPEIPAELDTYEEYYEEETVAPQEFTEEPEEFFEESEEVTETEESEEPPIDEDTATLLTALGYSGKGSETVKKKPAQETVRRNKISDLTLAYGYEGKEYTSRAQTAEIKSAYSRDHKMLILRLLGTALLVILLAIYDSFGSKFGGALDVTVYPVVNILMSLQILLIAAAFSAKQLYAGINGLVRSEPIFHSLSATAIILTVVYDIILAIAAPASFTLYNFPAGVCLLLGVAHDLFVLEREIYVFDRLSSWQSIATLERVDSAELSAELGEGRVGDTDRVGQAFRLRRGEFAENYFRHINRSHPSARVINYLVIVPVVALSLVLALITLASDHTFIEACNAFMSVNLLSLPAFMLVSMSYPFFTLISKTIGSDAVVFSESDVGEYKEVNTVVFEEADLFDESSLTINRISVCDKNRMQDVFDIMCGVSALYDRIGGRIAGAFRASTSEGDIPEDVMVQRVDDGGFIGIADGRQYIVGSDAYLTSLGIPVMRYYDDKYIASNPGGVVLHIAVDGAEVFKLYLTYRIPDSMLMVLGELPATKSRIIIRTIDPNINLDLVTRILSSGFDGKLTLIRKPYTENAEPALFEGASTVEGGIAVNGESPEAIIEAVRACRIFSSFTKLNFNVSMILFGIGVLLSVCLGIVGALVGLSSMLIFLFQAFTVAPGFILVHLTLGK